MNAWIPAALTVVMTVLINAVVVAYFYGRMSAKVETLSALVSRLCGDHTNIAVHDEKIKQQDMKIEWGTRQFEALWRAIRALGRGERVRDFDPLDVTNPPQP